MTKEIVEDIVTLLIYLFLCGMLILSLFKLARLESEHVTEFDSVCIQAGYSGGYEDDYGVRYCEEVTLVPLKDVVGGE